MKNISVKVKMMLMAMVTLLGLMTLGGIIILKLEGLEKKVVVALGESIRKDYDQSIQEQVDNAISMLNAVYAKCETGEYTMEEAQKVGADLLRDLRYGESGYFWADTYDGTNVVLLGSATEGTNRMETKDASGYQMVKEIIRVGMEPEGGFADYVFPKEGETEPSPKRSYSKSFEPFGWVVGTGNYIDYIDTTVAEQTAIISKSIDTTIYVILAVEIVIVLIAVGLCIYIGNSLSKAFKEALGYIGCIAKGDFTKPLPEILCNRRDDFGVLGEGLGNMKKQVSELIREVKKQGTEINGIVERVKENVYALGGNVEDVSATTQQLAAGMEETAASSETIKNMSHEIESAAKNIAYRSQDGAEQAANIHERAAKAQTDTKEQRAHARAIHNELQESLEKTLEEAKIVKEIEVLSSAIMEITNQTNLLALNASIEAARAGEAGKGFAVVATEIGGLADQSKQTVSKIQKVTEEVTAAVENLSKDAERLLEFVATDVVASYDMFGEVAEAYNKDAEEIDSLISDFSATSEELLASIDGVLDAMEGIASATNEGAQGTTNIANKAMDVRNRTEEVSDEVDKCDNTAKRLNEEIAAFTIE
ncbi:MAG: methyl-accepting chemotaxis protein [Clostridiales bacterium]|nr:methyl-accepting chemotaxis protein [Clostridiales bacterium]